MKQDVPERPAVPPRTRKAMHQAADIWLAQWAADPALPVAERRRAEEERARRREAEPEALGVIVDAGGLTPAQREWLRVRLSSAGAVHHCGAQSIHSACRQAGVASIRHDTRARSSDDVDRAIVRAARSVVVFPASSSPPPQEARGPWGMARYARHRSLPTTVVLADGTIERTR